MSIKIEIGVEAVADDGWAAGCFSIGCTIALCRAGPLIPDTGGMLMQPGNIFGSIPDNLDKELFEQIVQGDRVRIERIISRGQVSPESGWYDQEHNEWVIILRGGAVIALEDGAEVKLEQGDYLNIPAHTKHKVSWTDPETETVWLAVHY